MPPTRCDQYIMGLIQEKGGNLTCYVANVLQICAKTPITMSCLTINKTIMYVLVKFIELIYLSVGRLI